MLSVAFSCCYAESEWHYAERRFAECHYTECCYAECRYAECRGAEDYSVLTFTTRINNVDVKNR